MIRKWLSWLLALVLPITSAHAAGGAPLAGQYVPYCKIPVWSWDNATVAKCQALEPWANCLNTLVTRSESGIAFSGPLTISTAGTYSGNYHSTSAGTPAINVTASSGTVHVTGVILDGPGDLIKNPGGAAVEVDNYQAWGTSTVPGALYNAAANGVTAKIHDGVFSNLSGIVMNGASGTTAVTINNNIGYDMNGTGSVHFIILANGSFPGASIHDNVDLDAPWFSNRNDSINLYRAVGTLANPIDVSSNLIVGGYPPDPALGSYSGCGIITDGSAGDTSGNATQFVNIHGNAVFDTTNCGIATAAGHDNAAYGNTVVSSGVIGGSTAVHAQNVGIYAWNVYGQSGSAFANNTLHDNQIYWFKATNNTINNSFFGNGGADCTSCTGNTGLSSANTIAGALAVESQYLHPYLGNY